MKELVTVVVPILNPQINPTEERMLHHCLETLAQYPFVFITYQGADLSIVREHHEEIDVIYFPKKYFQSRDHLSGLFLLEDFYERFNWCDYLLIHELNSWVIRDELHYWCKQGYDYLKAAPAFEEGRLVNDHFLKRMAGLKDEEKRLFGQGYANNGLYLCRIEYMTNTLKRKKKEAYQYRHDDHLSHADSVFWELEANRFWPHLRKPTPVVRDHFALNAIGFNNKGPLPFALTGITRENIKRLPYFNSKGEA
jgi:hypothetical protein